MSHIDRIRRCALLAPVALPVAFAVATRSTTPAEAQELTSDQNIRIADASATADAAPSTAALGKAVEKIRNAGTVGYTGDADVDFIRTMIPVHEGAIAAAKVARDYGSDPDVRKLAESMLTQQQNQLDWMKDWLRHHNAP